MSEEIRQRNSAEENEAKKPENKRGPDRPGRHGEHGGTKAEEGHESGEENPHPRK